MMKKVLYGVFMAFFAVLTMGSLQSCTDDLDNIKIDTSERFKNLDGVVDQLKVLIDQNKKELDGKISLLQSQVNADIANLQGQISANDADIDKLNKDLNALAGEVANRVTYDELAKDLASLEAALKTYSDAGDAEVLAKSQAALEAAIDVVNARIDQLDADYQAKFADIQSQFTTMNDKVEANKTEIAKIWVELDNKQKAIDAINETLGKFQTKLTELETTVGSNIEKISQLTKDVVDLQKKYAELNDTLNQFYVEVFGEGGFRDQMGMIYNALQSDIDELNGKITELWDAIYTLEDKYDALTMRIDAMITSIVLQGVDSPVFGNLSLPIGIQTNMLFNWYFENLGESFTFPNAGTEYAYNGTGSIANAEDIAFIKGIRGDSFEVPSGLTETNLGKVYMTINPIGKDLLSGKTFYLETSKGAESRLPYTLNVQPSDDELMFNFTRSLENGFYESEVVVPADAKALDATKVHIDQTLQDALQAVLKDQTKRTALNLISAVWQQLNNSFKSYGVRAEWANPDLASREIYSVLSKYDLGVATAKPVSFKFLQGYGTDKKIRTFGHVENFFYWLKDNGKFSFDFSDVINMDDYRITLDGITIDPDQVSGNMISYDFKFMIKHVFMDQWNPDTNHWDTITDWRPDGAQWYYIELQDYTTDNLNDALKEGIIKALQDALGQMTTEMENKINNQLKNLVDDLITNMTAEINGKIDSILTGLGDGTDRWFERLNKLIDVYNKVANKVNHFLENPNEYLQPAIFYKADGKMGLLSTDKMDPTIFVQGGGQSFELFLSTYTCELAAPCYKKIVACTNVVNPDGSYAANGREIAAAINRSAQPLANVIPGNAHRLFVPTKEFKAAPGQCYEFLYQAVDYSGVTSTKKFYIKVK